MTQDNMKPHRGIILAAGRGSRMGELTDSSPKCLTVIQGQTLIERQIKTLKEAGIQQIAIVTGYKSDTLSKYGDHHFHNPHWASTNIVASLFTASKWLSTYDCIVSYSDIFYSSNIVSQLVQSDESIAISYDPDWLSLWSKRFENPLDDAETFELDRNNNLVQIGDRPTSVEHIQGQYMGLLKFKKNFWNDFKAMSISKQLSNIDMTSFLNLLINNRVKIKAIPNHDAWGECDTESDLEVYS